MGLRKIRRGLLCHRGLYALIYPWLYFITNNTLPAGGLQ